MVVGGKGGRTYFVASLKSFDHEPRIPFETVLVRCVGGEVYAYPEEYEKQVNLQPGSI